MEMEQGEMKSSRGSFRLPDAKTYSHLLTVLLFRSTWLQASKRELVNLMVNLPVPLYPRMSFGQSRGRAAEEMLLYYCQQRVE